MRKNKILFFLFICVGCFPVLGYAQVPKKVIQGVENLPKVSAEISSKLTGEIAKTLSAYPQELRSVLGVPVNNSEDDLLRWRAHQTWLKAQQVQERLPSTKYLATHSEKLSADLPVNPYPPDTKAGQLQTPQEWSRYFITKNNLEVRKWLPRFYERRQAIENRLEDFLTQAQSFTHPAQEDMAWLARQVSQHTNYVLLGEIHYHEQIPLRVGDFLRELRATQPERQIFLFTEFIAQNQTWGDTLDNILFAQYIPVWLTANSQNISIVGLELPLTRVTDDISCVETSTSFFPTNQQANKPIWGSIEGMRLRNQAWLARLSEYRQQYPEALFVVYSGEAHTDYMMPYSIGHALAGPQTLNVFLMSQGSANEFDSMTYGLLPQRIIKFNNNELSRLAGFDVQLRISDVTP